MPAPSFALPDLTPLTHLAGFGAGAALYAMLGVMAARSAPAAGPTGRDASDPRTPSDRIPLATALFGLTWNLGALALYGGVEAGGLDAGATVATRGPALVALGAGAFGALGFLPAVVVHAALLGVASRSRRALTAVAYGLSAAAAALHAWGALADGTTPSRAALLLLTVGYAALLSGVWLRLRRQPGARGPLAAAALGSFAVTALHLGQHAPGHGDVAWELLGHHASIPLALVILYQDWRFALADLFLKRALAALAVVAGALAAHVLVVVPIVLPRLTADPADPWAAAVLALLLGATLAVAGPIRRRLDAFVDGVVLRRPDYAALRAEIAAAVARADDERAVLDAACARLAPALAADVATWRVDATAAAVASSPAAQVGATVAVDERRVAAQVAVPTAESPGYRLEIGGLRGGRRLLSDDAALLEHVALLAARRLDVLRIAHERCTREAHALEAERLAAEAELRALRAQLQPHFLFNALTTIGWLVQSAPDRALLTLQRLTELLRAVLRSPSGELVPLADELAICEAYLAIETARFEERLRVAIDVSAEARAVAVPPLLLQPLVENAVKHGISALRAGGSVTLHARVERPVRGRDGAVLHVEVRDTGAGADLAAVARRRAAGGLGLASVERRLARLYGERAAFALRTAPGEGCVVTLALPLDGARHARATTDGDATAAATSVARAADRTPAGIA